MAGIGAEQKSGEIAANFCLSPETRHSRCWDPTAKFAPYRTVTHDRRTFARGGRSNDRETLGLGNSRLQFSLRMGEPLALPDLEPSSDPVGATSRRRAAEPHRRRRHARCGASRRCCFRGRQNAPDKEPLRCIRGGDCLTVTSHASHAFNA